MVKLFRHGPANLGTQPTARHWLPQSAFTGSATVPVWPHTSLLTRTHPEVLLVRALKLQLNLTLGNPVDYSKLLCPWDPPGKNAGVDCHFLLQGILPIQGWNPRLLCALAGGFFTTRTTREVGSFAQMELNREPIKRTACVLSPRLAHVTAHCNACLSLCCVQGWGHVLPAGL